MKIRSNPVHFAGSALARSTLKLGEEIPSYSPQMRSTDEELWRQSVELWMQWHAAQEKLTAAMYACRNEPSLQAELMQEMDHLDQLRWRAVEISQELLSTSPV